MHVSYYFTQDKDAEIEEIAELVEVGNILNQGTEIFNNLREKGGGSLWKGYKSQEKENKRGRLQLCKNNV